MHSFGSRVLVWILAIVAILAVLLFASRARAQDVVIPHIEASDVLVIGDAELLPAQPNYRTEKRINLSAMVIAAFLDEGTTAWCIGAGTCYEKNAFLSWAVTKSGALFALTKGAATVFTLLVVDWLYDHGHPKAARTVAWIATGSWGAAGVSNAVQNARRGR